MLYLVLILLFLEENFDEDWGVVRLLFRDINFIEYIEGVFTGIGRYWIFRFSCSGF